MLIKSHMKSTPFERRRRVNRCTVVSQEWWQVVLCTIVLWLTSTSSFLWGPVVFVPEVDIDVWTIQQIGFLEGYTHTHIHTQIHRECRKALMVCWAAVRPGLRAGHSHISHCIDQLTAQCGPELFIPSFLLSLPTVSDPVKLELYSCQPG